MLTSILCAFVLSGAAIQNPVPPGAPSQNQNRKSIWDGLNIKRTGSNGYEEYLDAIDLFREARIGDIVSQRKVQMSPTDLELCRRILAKMGPVLAKIEQGNLKDVRDPRNKMDVLTAFPELSQFRNISKAMTACSLAQFAAGDSKGATNNFIIGLDMSDKVSRFTLISGLVGIANHSILLASLSRHLDQLSVNDAIRLEQFVTSYFSRPNSTAQVMQRELQLNAQVIRDLMINPTKDGLDDYVHGSDGDDSDTKEWKEFFRDWNALSVANRTRIVDTVCKRLSDRNDELQRILVKPEKEWIVIQTPPADGFEGKIEEIFGISYQSIVSSFARVRTQLRLLRLHSAIRQFRFEHDQLPQSLSKLDKQLYIYDPLTGENFIYEQKGELVYELYSKGNAQTGRIDLKYNRLPGEERTDPNIPPFLCPKLARLH